VKEVLILGGGLTGLSAGYELSKAGYKVRIIERDSIPGGLARFFPVTKTWLDVYYRHIFTSNETFLRMAAEMKLTDKITWKKTLMGFFYDGKIYRATPFKLLFDFKPLSFSDRINFGLLVLKILRKKDWKDLDSITAKDWITDNYGKKCYDVIFKPLMKIKWGKVADDVSAAWLWGRIKPRAQSRSGSFLSEKLGYMEGSFKTFIDALVSEIEKKGGKIETNSNVKKITVGNGSVSGTTYEKNGKEKNIESDLVISTLPITVFLDAVTDVETDYEKQLRKIKYNSVISTVISLKKKLSDVYWMNICSELPFGGLVEHTNFIDPSVYGNQNLTYLFNYLNMNDSMWKLSEKELLNNYNEGLKQIFPDFNEKDIRWFKVFRDMFATPVYEKGYSEYMPDYRTPIKGLYFSGVFLTYPLNRNMDTALKAGLEVAKIIMGK
jgi:protoporphyrinogen oxidase